MEHPHPEMIDEDNPELTEADFARARPATEVLPELFGHVIADEFLNLTSDGIEGRETRMAAALKRTMPR